MGLSSDEDLPLFPLQTLYNEYSVQINWIKSDRTKFCAAQGWNSPFEREVLSLPMLFLAVVLTEPRGWNSCTQGPDQSCLLPHLLQFLCALNHEENAKTTPRGGAEILRQSGNWSHLQCGSISTAYLFLKTLPGVVLMGAQLLLKPHLSPLLKCKHRDLCKILWGSGLAQSIFFLQSWRKGPWGR